MMIYLHVTARKVVSIEGREGIDSPYKFVFWFNTITSTISLETWWDI